MQIEALEFDSVDEAIQETYASGFGTAILVGGKTLVVSLEVARQLEAAGVQFAYVDDVEGRIVTVPVN